MLPGIEVFAKAEHVLCFPRSFKHNNQYLLSDYICNRFVFKLTSK